MKKEHVRPSDDELVKQMVALTAPTESREADEAMGNSWPYECNMTMFCGGGSVQSLDITREEYQITKATVAALREQLVAGEVDQEWMSETPDPCSYGIVAFELPLLSGDYQQSMELSVTEYDQVKRFILALRLTAAHRLIAETDMNERGLLKAA
jgi:hypothetical protein